MLDRAITIVLIGIASVASVKTSVPSQRVVPDSEEPHVTSVPPGRRGGTLFVASIGLPKTLNPHLASDTATMQITEPLNAALVGYDSAEQRTSEGLAKSYTVSEDELVWTFRLRRGIRWSDGQPFDADDAVFSFRVAFDPVVFSSAGSALQQSDGSYPRVEKVDSHTIRLTLKEPHALTLDNVGLIYMLPRHKHLSAYEAGTFVTQLGLDASPKEVVGLGPFRLKERVVTGGGIERVVLERNPFYWKKDRTGQRLPYLDEVIYRVLPDQNVALHEFVAGELDLLASRPEEHDLLAAGAAAGGYTVHKLAPGMQVVYLLFNRSDPLPSSGPREAARRRWFSEVKFRQAIAHTVDRERIVGALFDGKADVTYSLTTPGNRVWHDEAAVIRYPRDLRKAKQLLAEMGIKDRTGDGLLEDAKGNPIEFAIRTNDNNPTRIALVKMIVEDLKELGIVATGEYVPFNEIIRSLQLDRDFDAVVGGWISSNPPDPLLMRDILVSSGNLHYTRPQQTKPATEWERKIDQLMELNQRTLDLATRRRQFAEVTRLWTENLPEIDLVAPHQVVVARKRVGNLRPAPLAFVAWNVDELYVTGPPAGNRPRDRSADVARLTRLSR